MNDLAIDNVCHQITAEEWEEIVTSYERGAITLPDAPYRDLEFLIEFPFLVKSDDTLLLSAYSESRGINHRIYDGASPQEKHIKARLAIGGEDDIETYWFSVDLIRPSLSMTCNWSMEERFDLIIPQNTVRWRLELLAEPIPTSDGGSRLTRFSPL